MKKIFQLLALFTALPFLSIAQITIEASQINPLGVFATQAKDTTLDVSIAPGGTGLQTWDFSALKVQTTDSLAFYTPDQTAYAALFPSANLAVTVDSFAVIYLEKNNDHIATLGTYGTITIPPITVTTAYHYNTPQSIIRFPMELNQAYTENVVGMVRVTGQEVGIPSDSVRYQSFIEKNVTVDAYGQLTTPIGVFDVLRTTEIETSYDSVHIQSNGIYFPYYATPLKTLTIHNWWTNQNGIGFPVVQIKDSPDTGTSALWLNDFVSSTRDSKTFLQVNIAPNPTSNLLHVELPEGFNGLMEIYDLNGKRLLASSASSGMETLNVQSLATGSFVLILKDKKGKVAGFERFEVVR